jgi:hypothetical protein
MKKIKVNKISLSNYYKARQQGYLVEIVQTVFTNPNKKPIKNLRAIEPKKDIAPWDDNKFFNILKKYKIYQGKK